ncbi:hypothetical protein BDR06DRAFT_955431 [Suillus hirtellus]|nr:hypothetical protein BDR06DRAFT_955431 [Suillus hirtellus]
MRVSLLAIVIALTASMFVSACFGPNQPCNDILECCDGYVCYKGNANGGKICQ